MPTDNIKISQTDDESLLEMLNPTHEKSEYKWYKPHKSESDKYAYLFEVFGAPALGIMGYVRGSYYEIIAGIVLVFFSFHRYMMEIYGEESKWTDISLRAARISVVIGILALIDIYLIK